MSADNRHSPLGRTVAGAVLVLVGALWLVEEFTDADLPWTGVLAAILILVGATLMLAANTGPHGGLVALGIGLTVLLVASSAFSVLADVPFTGGVGDNDLAPTVLEDEYRWAVGSMTLDLSNAELDGGVLEASVGLGELIVILPSDAVTIDAGAGIGEVLVFDTTQSGVSPEVIIGAPGGTQPELRLVLRVGIGKVEVRRR
ncbi:MAG TPA: hypothetical protein VFY15_07695 [Acidimicrobiia bacterium]|nr:hypothetical protein [Acidimicrobiia bacterium]